MHFFIIHGAYGNPDENWFPWLKQQLESHGHTVSIPAFPTPENQTLANWMDVFSPYLPKIDRETVFVGHSLGPAFILSVLERISVPVQSCFFVSGFVGLLGDKRFDSINSSFVTKDFHWQRIRENCGRFVLYHSDNDPYVPAEKAHELATKLNGELIVVSGGGHLNADGGYHTFPALLDDILSMSHSTQH